MKHSTSIPPATINETEWRLQEQARLSMPATDNANDDLIAYQAIDEALRTPPANALPHDFAASIARIAQGQEAAQNDGLEQNLIRILGAVLGISGGVALAFYAGDLLPGASASFIQFGGTTLGWTGATLGCIGVSWLCSHLLQAGRSPTSR
jgi:hypothetical protein